MSSLWYHEVKATIIGSPDKFMAATVLSPKLSDVAYGHLAADTNPSVGCKQHETVDVLCSRDLMHVSLTVAHYP